ncbi:hypothetical protein B0H13DRAFT_2352186 [Mycena leptocephala]|nr:hypothetical protein B0H13DRAFT_2352186 [Mycena leptocephala]
MTLYFVIALVCMDRFDALAKSTQAIPNGWMLTRFLPADESRKTMMEANMEANVGTGTALDRSGSFVLVCSRFHFELG